MMQRLKVLMVCEDIPGPMLGGLAKHVVALSHALMDAGHEVTLMGRDQPLYADCAVEIGFRGRFIPGFGDPFKGWKEKQLGIFNPWKRPYFARTIARAIKHHAIGFNVVHYHGHFAMVGRYLPATLNFVQTRHDQGSECITHLRFRNGDVCVERSPEACAGCASPHAGPLRTAISAAAVRRYRSEISEAFGRHSVVFVSEALRSNYRKVVPDAPMALSSVVHNFVNESALRAATQSQATQPAGVRVHVAGRLDDGKGILELLALLAPQLPDGWSVNVYGDGPLRAKIESAHCGQAVRLIGHRPYDEIIGAMRLASVVVMPSLCEESFGMVTLEALRLGKVCYALQRGGTPELVRYGAPGHLRLFHDLPTLVAALLTDHLPADKVGGESADVHARLPELLALYSHQLQVRL